ncbi:hypothetical protein D3C77_260680 [compost metagenome]
MFILVFHWYCWGYVSDCFLCWLLGVDCLSTFAVLRLIDKACDYVGGFRFWFRCIDVDVVLRVVDGY